MKSKAGSVKAIGLISGGLDSLIAAKLLQSQGIDVLGVTFLTPFWDYEKTIAIATANNIPIKLIDIRKEHFELVKSPSYGYGSFLNPCIDCHGLMLKKAGEMLKEEEASFIFTGEVVGQRPMSQRKRSLKEVEMLSGYGGKILRPLSARLLPPTEPEIKGFVDRSNLLGINGRGRKQQNKLAELYNITAYETPAGGCLLTKEGYTKKLKTLLTLSPYTTWREAELVKWGRVVSKGNIFFFLGRSEKDNEKLLTYSTEKDYFFKTLSAPGPCALLPPLFDRVESEHLYWIASMVGAFSDATPGSPFDIMCVHGGNTRLFNIVIPLKNQFYHSIVR